MTPQWVRLSSVDRSFEQICTEDLTEFFSAFSMKLQRIYELGWSKERPAFGDIDAPIIKCDDIREALRVSQSWSGVALFFRVDEISQSIGLHLRRDPLAVSPSTTICLYLAREIVWHESDDHRRGEWLLKFLLMFSSALKADCAGYGRDPDYDVIYEPLDPKRIVARLRDGSLVRIAEPVIHVISVRLIAVEQVKALIAGQKTYPGFQYRESIAGYHLLWNV